MKSTSLLKEYVRCVLTEDDGGYGGFGGDLGGPYGMSFGSQKDLYNVFVKPFTDVVSTAAAETKKLSQRTQTALNVITKVAITSFVPFLGQRYEQIFADQKTALDKIKSEYKDVYDATWTAFKDNDILISAFFYSPPAIITAGMVKKTPPKAVALLNVLSGGKLDNFLAKVKKAFKLGDTKKPLDRDTGSGVPEGLVREDDEDEKTKKREEQLVKTLTQEKVIDVIEKNPRVRNMMKATQKAVNASLVNVAKTVEALEASSTLADIEKLVGKRVPELEKLKQLQPQERDVAEKAALDQIKKATKAFYVKNLEAQISTAIKAGVPKDHPFISAIAKTLQAIKT